MWRDFVANHGNRMRNWGATRFIDCHNHAPGTTLMYDVLVGNPYEVEFVTIDSIVDKLRARAAGFDRHCTKPVDPGDLEGLFSLP